MPNWVYTMLEVSGEESELASFRQTIETINDEGEEDIRILERCVPMPRSLEGTTSPGDCPNWHDWQLENWGTKWGDCETTLEQEGKDFALYRLEFPWALPNAGLITISKNYPNLDFEIDCTEEGGFFYGEISYKNGVVVDNLQEGERPDLED